MPFGRWGEGSWRSFVIGRTKHVTARAEGSGREQVGSPVMSGLYSSKSCCTLRWMNMACRRTRTNKEPLMPVSIYGISSKLTNLHHSHPLLPHYSPPPLLQQANPQTAEPEPEQSASPPTQSTAHPSTTAHTPPHPPAPAHTAPSQ